MPANLHMDRQQAFQIVCEAIDVVNRQLPASKRLEKVLHTPIAGALDSLGLINLVVTLEEKASDAVGAPVQLLDESALIDANGPFHSVESLTSFLTTLAAARG